MSKKPKAPFSPPHYNLRGPKISGPLDIDSWLDSNYWVGVSSSTVVAIRYDEVGHKLFVQFAGQANKASEMYIYDNVPKDVARDMYNSSSQGKFIHYRLKGKFPVVGPVVKT